MPDPRPRLRPNLSMTPENIRTGVVVSVVISVIAIVVLSCVAVTSFVKRAAKLGMRSGLGRNVTATRRAEEDVGLEVGIVREVVPAYCREVREGEKVLVGAR
jgi:hypothetical protein